MAISVKIGPLGQVMKFIKMLLYGFQYINNDFYGYVQLKFEELKYNGQLINLQKRLNDLFDPSGRGIFIVNSTTISLTWIYRYTEHSPVYIFRHSEDSTLFIKRHGESVESSDFIINVPSNITYSDPFFNSIVNRYKLSDKNYTINLYTP